MTPIQFADWILNSGYSPVSTHEGMRWSHARIGSQMYTTIQLYSIFLEESDDKARTKSYKDSRVLKNFGYKTDEPS